MSELRKIEYDSRSYKNENKPFWEVTIIGWSEPDLRRVLRILSLANLSKKPKVKP